MQSFASRALPLAMTILGYKRGFSSVEKTLARMKREQQHPSKSAPPASISRRFDVTLDVSSGWPVYTVGPRGRRATRRALYLHGGTYVFQISPQHWTIVAELAETTDTLFTVPIYPLAPVETAATIVAEAARLATVLISEVGAAKTSILGDSAGGGMALAVAMMLRDDGVEAPHATVLISPWLDISGTDPELARLDARDPWLAVAGCQAAGAVYRGELAENDWRVSPLNGSLAGLGSLTMLSGTRDILNADAQRLVRLARQSNEAGTPVDLNYIEAPEMLHVYPLLPIAEAKAGRQAIREAISG